LLLTLTVSDEFAIYAIVVGAINNQAEQGNPWLTARCRAMQK